MQAKKTEAKGHDGNKGANPQDSTYQPRPPQFGGNCNNCGKYGHKFADCWQAKKTEGKGRDSKGKGKGKGKKGKGANSLTEWEKEPEGELSAWSWQEEVWDMGCLEAVSTAATEAACLSPLEPRPTKDDWMRTNLDSGCAMTTFPRAYGTGNGGNGREYKTASGEFIKDEGGVSVTARDEHNECERSQAESQTYTSHWCRHPNVPKLDN